MKSDLIEVLRLSRSATMKTVTEFHLGHIDYKPSNTAKTVAEQIQHILWNEAVIRDGVFNNRWDYESQKPPLPGTMLEAYDYLSKSIQETIAKIESRTNLQVTQIIDNSPFWKGRSIEGFLYGLAEHEAHHRGQLIAYLHILGINPPQVYSS